MTPDDGLDTVRGLGWGLAMVTPWWAWIAYLVWRMLP